MAASTGLNAADLKRLVNDAKALYATDVLAEKPLQSINVYLDVAVRRVVESNFCRAADDRDTCGAKPRLRKSRPSTRKEASLGSAGARSTYLSSRETLPQL